MADEAPEAPRVRLDKGAEAGEGAGRAADAAVTGDGSRGRAAAAPTGGPGGTVLSVGPDTPGTPAPSVPDQRTVVAPADTQAPPAPTLQKGTNPFTPPTAPPPAAPTAPFAPPSATPATSAATPFAAPAAPPPNPFAPPSATPQVPPPTPFAPPPAVPPQSQANPFAPPGAHVAPHPYAPPAPPLSSAVPPPPIAPDGPGQVPYGYPGAPAPGPMPAGPGYGYPGPSLPSYPGGPGGYGGWPGMQAAPNNGMGTAGMVTGIISAIGFCLTPVALVTGILAIVLGVLGRARVRRGEATNPGQALAGIICGSAGLVLAAAFIALIVFAETQN
ncbi:DUF4190 domain-containing protein [Streptomyces sp. NPDC021562]|uniref:DUF4190 domain-containing protein n=1 Tax=Streptomyces sp. NPDC021562 TaxID=3155121 RepID=UPI0033C808CE